MWHTKETFPSFRPHRPARAAVEVPSIRNQRVESTGLILRPLVARGGVRPTAGDGRNICPVPDGREPLFNHERGREARSRWCRVGFGRAVFVHGLLPCNGRLAWGKRPPCLECFPCVCPEPVLVKCSFSIHKWLKRTVFTHRGLSRCWTAFRCTYVHMPHKHKSK